MEFRDERDESLSRETFQELNDKFPDLKRVATEFGVRALKSGTNILQTIRQLHVTGLDLEEMDLDFEVIRDAVYADIVRRLNAHNGISLSDYRAIEDFVPPHKSSFTKDQQKEILHSMMRYMDQASANRIKNIKQLADMGYLAGDMTKLERRLMVRTVLATDEWESGFNHLRAMLFTDDDIIAKASEWTKDVLRRNKNTSHQIVYIVKLAKVLNVDLEDLLPDYENILMRMSRDNFRGYNMSELVYLLGDRAPERAKVHRFIERMRHFNYGSRIRFPSKEGKYGWHAHDTVLNWKDMTLESIEALNPPVIDWKKLLIDRNRLGVMAIQDQMISIELEFFGLEPIPSDPKYQVMAEKHYDKMEEVIEAILDKFPDAAQADIKLRGNTWSKEIFDRRPDLRDRYLRRLGEAYNRVNDEGTKYLNKMARAGEIKGGDMSRAIDNHGSLIALILDGMLKE